MKVMNGDYIPIFNVLFIFIDILISLFWYSMYNILMVFYTVIT